MGLQNLPFAIVFTKSDKLSVSKVTSNVENFKTELLKYWDELPPIFVTSAEKKLGKEDILHFVSENIPFFSSDKKA
jgi:GTP-binding protein